MSGAVDDFEMLGGELVERDPPFACVEESLVVDADHKVWFGERVSVVDFDAVGGGDDGEAVIVNE